MRCLRFHAIGNHYAAVLTFIKLSVFGVMLQVIQTIFIPRAASPIVIVERSTESIHTRTVIGNDYIFAVVNKRAQCALFIVEFCRETIAADFYSYFAFNYFGSFSRSCLGNALASLRSFHFQLFLCLHIAFLCPRHIVREHESHTHEIFLVGFQQRTVQAQRNKEFGTRRYGFYVGKCAAGYFVTVFLKNPFYVVNRRFEIVLVEHLYPAVSCAQIPVYCHRNILINLFHFIILRFWRKIREHHSVKTESTVVGIVAEITAIGYVAFTLRSVVVKSVINPFPNGSAAKEIGRFNGIPIIHEISSGISHGMSVFGNMKRVFQLGISLHGIPYPSYRRILIGTHVYNFVIALILYGTRSIEILYSLVACLEIIARSRFVAQ